MISKKEIKYLASLKQKKFRLLNNEFVVEGEKIILDAIKHKQSIIKIIYSKKNKILPEVFLEQKFYYVKNI